MAILDKNFKLAESTYLDQVSRLHILICRNIMLYIIYIKKIKK